LLCCVQGVEQARYAVLSTVTTAGLPACRTVVLRDIHEDRALVITTDIRSHKIAQIRQREAKSAVTPSQQEQEGQTAMSPASPSLPSDGSEPETEPTEPSSSSPLTELCCWFPNTKEQYRLLSRTLIVTAASPSSSLLSLRSAVWQQLSPPSRSQFEQPAPGTARRPPARGDLDRYQAQHPSASVVSANFALLLLFPVRGDYLFLPKAQVSPHPVAIETAGGVQEGERDSGSQARWQMDWTEAEQRWRLQQVNP
jgi:hypothetical protein